MTMIIFIMLALLTVMALAYIAAIIKNRDLSLNKKAGWAIVVLLIPIIGGIAYLNRKGG